LYEALQFPQTLMGPIAPAALADAPAEVRAEGELSSSLVSDLPVIDVQGVLAAAATKLAAYDLKNAVKTRYPIAAGANSKTWSTGGPGDWTSGFYPGMLWQMYEATGDPVWLARAQSWTAGIESQKNNTRTHDVGFMIYNSFGQGVRLTGDARYQSVVLQAARSLSSRYNPKVGAIRSWNSGSYKVIIDNMMNLELLFYAAKNGGTTSKGGSSQALYDMAVSHATKTLQNHVRPDGSTYHVVNYNPSTGRVSSKTTAQGLSASSTWSRGQAWATYGFTMTFRETGDPMFLDAARRTADYFIDHLPADKVPAADFKSKFTDLAHKDSSAAAIAASALIELSTLDPDPAHSERYWTSAVEILSSLTSPTYFSSGPDHPGLLLHGARKYPGDNVSLIFGDYYLLEATLRYSRAVQASV
jgi:unsaturated chondroitin disaccharide hydrolase